ncbi:hypothetical protein AB0J63_10410 [Streptosporangium canum]|uniref:hypothetical protein n=1 Tax=Streptosporangium canum TaxID=324952 RepID=UPI003443CD34
MTVPAYAADEITDHPRATGTRLPSNAGVPADGLAVRSMAVRTVIRQAGPEGFAG